MMNMDSHSYHNAGKDPGKPPALSESEFQALVEMVGPDSPEVLVDLLDTYIDESSGLVAAIESALGSGELQSALRPAHSLKSSSASIGALTLSRLCADLEAHLRGGMPGLNVPEQVLKITDEFARVSDALLVERAKFAT
jgi:HPt (histidine-containing phosphotransfer) domain-containing protein